MNKEDIELDLMLSQILELRFGNGTGQDLQVKLALKEITQLIQNLKHKWQAEAREEMIAKIIKGNYKKTVKKIVKKLKEKDNGSS